MKKSIDKDYLFHISHPDLSVGVHERVQGELWAAVATSTEVNIESLYNKSVLGL